MDFTQMINNLMTSEGGRQLLFFVGFAVLIVFIVATRIIGEKKRSSEQFSQKVRLFLFK